MYSQLPLKIAASQIWGNTLIVCMEPNYYRHQMETYSLTLPRESDPPSKPALSRNYRMQQRWEYKSNYEMMSSIFQKTAYSDVSFKCENRIISAHRVILAARCKYFDNMFMSIYAYFLNFIIKKIGGMKESSEKEIVISDFSYDTFKSFFFLL